jgi:hypothetical protein
MSKPIVSAASVRAAPLVFDAARTPDAAAAGAEGTQSAHIIFPATTNLFPAKPFAAAALIKCLETALEGRRGEANT